MSGAASEPGLKLHSDGGLVYYHELLIFVIRDSLS